MKLKITEKGVYNADGEPIKVGQVMTIKGDEIPPNLTNKCAVVAVAPKKVAVTNPAEKPVGKAD